MKHLLKEKHLPFLNEFIDCINDFVFVMEVTSDGEFKYVTLNSTAQASIGQKDVIGYKIEEVIPENYALILLEHYKQVIESKDKVIFEFSDNQMNTFEEVSLNPFFGENGEISYIVSITRDISKRKRVERELSINEQKYKSLVENNSDSVFALDLEGNFLSVNQAGERLSGYHKDELIGTNFSKLVLEECLEETYEHFLKAKAGSTEEYKVKVIHKNEEVALTLVKNVPIIVEGEVIGIYGIAKDITEEHEMNKIIKYNEEFYRNLIDQSPDPILIHQEGFIKYGNYAFMKLVEASSKEQLFGKALNDFIPFIGRSSVEERVNELLEGGHSEPVEGPIVTLDGEARQVEFFETTTTYKGKPAIHAVLRDITKRKELETKIEKMAFYDYLTDLPNRQLFKEHMEKAIENAKRKNTSFALLFIDGDEFKDVNDTVGHEGGDAFIKEFASRLSESVRNVDTVARIGGDEFNILLADINDEKQVVNIIERINENLSRPWEYDGYSMDMTMSVGIALYPDHGESMKSLVIKADDALYTVKERGGNDFQFYNESIGKTE
ncbi:diguanylate cyclase [Bacillus shivajii]|uniref:diguanylate cyclase domain-containing protein n=1 Tax=Bacillus shivajii TaxID=1983719 RepID=UPI001CFADF46|nr:diguanylate cyclase [Bacillus shivajii]UCZ52149.1 diguanylate cyclase [Bacillus shivajii]